MSLDNSYRSPLLAPLCAEEAGASAIRPTYEATIVLCQRNERAGTSFGARFSPQSLCMFWSLYESREGPSRQGERDHLFGMTWQWLKTPWHLLRTHWLELILLPSLITFLFAVNAPMHSWFGEKWRCCAAEMSQVCHVLLRICEFLRVGAFQNPNAETGLMSNIFITHVHTCETYRLHTKLQKCTLCFAGM